MAADGLDPAYRRALDAVVEQGAGDRVAAHFRPECEWAPVTPTPGVPLRCVTHGVDLLPPVPEAP